MSWPTYKINNYESVCCWWFNCRFLWDSYVLRLGQILTDPHILSHMRSAKSESLSQMTVHEITTHGLPHWSKPIKNRSKGLGSEIHGTKSISISYEASVFISKHLESGSDILIICEEHERWLLQYHVHSFQESTGNVHRCCGYHPFQILSSTQHLDSLQNHCSLHGDLWESLCWSTSLYDPKTQSYLETRLL